LILEILNTLHLSPNIVYGSVGNTKVLPVSATKFMMSSNENIIFPGTLPKVTVDLDGSIKVGFDKIKDPKTNKPTFKVSTGRESKINGYSFLLDESGNNITSLYWKFIKYIYKL
jgi:hypothetical protein